MPLLLTFNNNKKEPFSVHDEYIWEKNIKWND